MNPSAIAVIVDALPYLAKGMGLTLGLTVLVTCLGLCLGAVLALMKLSPIRALSAIASMYVDTIRAIPLLLVIFWFYFLVPYLGAWIVGAASPIQVGAFKSALISFTFFEAAYFCEMFRAGIGSIGHGQKAAGYALGLTYFQTMRYVVFPQAIRNMAPPIATRIIVIFQDTSLVYVLSMTDFLGAASKIGQMSGRLTELYLLVAVVYLLMCFAASRAVRRLEHRARAV
ncbi:amino acid ABC transporter permease [Pandoraea anhela]|uniref:Glutamate/aspartate import permease protein GltK n=1 Tax=Pandoraea anhela TaxID=2508295 RepID=A0A5E4WIT2_9BURK|nr:amino acid ABC transporter permease [Pandoraea anhela]VVE23494.1 amino acid ABC transporter permease [Pandoraea anhela]